MYMYGRMPCSRLEFRALLFFSTSGFLLTFEALFGALLVRIASLFDMNLTRESKLVNLTVSIFSIFALLRATRNCAQTFVNEATCWHESIFAKHPLFSKSAPATKCRGDTYAVVEIGGF